MGLLGAGVGILIGVDALLGTAALAVAAALVMARTENSTIPADTHVGIIGHIGLALGFVLLAGMDTVRADLLGYLFGDVLALSAADIVRIAGAGLAVLVSIALLWRPLLRISAAGDIAAAECGYGKWPQTAFLVLVAVLVAFGLKVVGALLIVALLIIPPATARLFARTPVQMAAIAAVVGALSAPLGLAAAYAADAPAGPSIVLAAGAMFLMSSAAIRVRQFFGRRIRFAGRPGDKAGKIP
jgi:zinc transport system permease protein